MTTRRPRTYRVENVVFVDWAQVRQWARESRRRRQKPGKP